MKPWQFLTSVSLAAACLVAAITLTLVGLSNRGLQQELGGQQEIINKGSMSQQIGTALLRDMAVSSVKDAKIKELLEKNGYNVNYNPNGEGSTR